MAAFEKSSVDVDVAARPRQSPYPMIDVPSALEVIFRQTANACPNVNVPTDQSVGHVLRTSIQSQQCVPDFHASIKDGYAVVASDGVGPRKVLLPEKIEFDSLRSGYCVRVHTGGPIPLGADAVVEVEQTCLLETLNGHEWKIEINQAPVVGQDIRPRGNDIDCNEILFKPGVTISSAELGVLYSIGCRNVCVAEKPKVAVISTGDELCEPFEQTLPVGRVRDTNRYMLIQLLNDFGYQPVNMGIVRDNADDILTIFKQAFQTVDIVVSSGGMSMSEKDMVKQVLEQDLKFSLHFGRVFMKPGKPTAFMTGSLDGRRKFFFGLPGNPVSAWVTAHLFVIPALRRMEGRSSVSFPIFPVQVADYYNLDPRPEYVRALYAADGASAEWKANIFEPNQASSRLQSIKNANLLLILPAKSKGRPCIRPGDTVSAMLVRLNL